MRRFISSLINILKNFIGEENWEDPVLSKIISTVIVLIFGSILSGIYVLYVSLFKSISIKIIFDRLTTFVLQHSYVPNWLIIFFVIICISLILSQRIRFVSNMPIQKSQPIKDVTISFLVGHWLCEWTSDGGNGSEDVEIKQDGKYYANGDYWFVVKDFKYDYKSNQISFFKKPIKPHDNRNQVKNILKINNDNLISGEEESHKIKYTRQV